MSTINFLNLITLRKTYGAGDFRLPECIELLKEADIVVTNPPFSLLREFIAQLVEYNKKFLILGNVNAIHYRKIFPLFKNNKIWLGISIHSGDRKFRLKSYVDHIEFDENGDEYVKVSGVRWFTNLKITKRNKPLMLEGSYYTPEKYPKYDNYDAINVNKVADIPCDYPGVMGVPTSFMDKYCPEQFRIIGLDRYTVPKKDLIGGCLAINSKIKYARILIKNKHPQKSEERKKVNKIFTLPESFLADCALVVEKKVA